MKGYPMNLSITFLYCEDCPSHHIALQELQQIMAEDNIPAALDIIQVQTEEQAQDLQFIGSPTILVNGKDIAPPSSEANYALTCRAYQLEDGRISPLPAPTMIRKALRDAGE
jgi:hypothetical protein